MTEREELEKGVMESKIRQTYEQINAYMDRLTLAINEAEKRHKTSKALYMVAWIVWVASSFLPDDTHYLFTLVFMFGLMYDSFCFTKVMRAYGEFRGAIEILRILGYIPPVEGGDKRKKRRRTASEFVDVVKGWAARKKKAQEAYAPA